MHSFSEDSDIIVEEVLDELHSVISAAKPTKIRKTNNALFFSAGMFRFVGRWNKLKTITEGEILVTKSAKHIVIENKLNFLEALVFWTMYGFVGFFFPGGVIAKFILFPVLTLLVYTLTVAATISSFNRWTKRIVTAYLESKKGIEISVEQREWIIDDSKCDACGYVVNAQANTCPDCGLTLR